MFPKHKIEFLQLALTSLGLYGGKIDGIVGPMTLVAVQTFEALVSERSDIEKPEEHEEAKKPEVLDTAIEGPGSDIEEALLFTLKNEGGFSDHPLDKGGPTNKGITIGRLSDYLGRDATRDEVKNLDHETIKVIYKKYYWDQLGLDNILDQSIATTLFDMGVLCGTGTAAKLCQEVLGITQTKKMDIRTLEAINATTDSEFIPAFADRNIQRFKEIIALHPNQAVFLNGWTNRANRLRTLINSDDTESAIPELAPGSQVGKGLYELADQVGVPRDDIKRMIDWLVQNRPASNPRYWAVFKIKEHSSKKRMHIFDRLEKKVQSVHATHGKASDPDHDGLATRFSNVSGSHKSSLGLYRTLNTYPGRHGRSLRLKGLEGRNSNAFDRAIVFHGVSYAGEEYVNRHGKCGRSLGCPAVSYDVVQDLIDKLKGGSLLLIS